MKFEFRVDAANASANLGEIATRGATLGVPLAAIAELVEGGLARNVATRGGYLGGPWPGLADATRDRKARQGLPDDELRATGELLTALEGGEGSVSRVTPSTVRVGIKGDLYRARFQMAAGRALVGVSPADEAVAVTILHEWIEGTGSRGRP